MANARASQYDFGLELAVYGYRDFRDRLKEFDPKLRRAMDKRVRNAIRPVQARAVSLVPNAAPVSGWAAESGSNSVWRTRLGWSSADVAKGIIISQGNKTRRKRQATTAAWSIVNRNPAGAVYELAGKQGGSGAPQSQRFLRALTDSGGRASRLIWRAWDEMDGENTVQREVLAIVREYESLLQRDLNAARSKD